jgi:site-specific DNA-methyltransferase (adenine-specific)
MPRVLRPIDPNRGSPLQDTWTDIDAVNAMAAERLGYPTQKPVALLERIIEASSNPGDVVLDPFCGCGTTIEAALNTGRRWVGIDVADVAVDVIRGRLEKKFPDVDYEHRIIPPDVESATRLARQDPHAFQSWALRRIRAREAVTSRGRRSNKGGDRGIDGEILVRLDNSEMLRVLVSVKGGANLAPTMLRDLFGTVGKERAHMGLLVTMAQPTKNMLRDAREMGAIDSPLYEDGCPRYQILTVEDIFAGRMPLLPGRNVTFDGAAPAAQLALGLERPAARAEPPQLPLTIDTAVPATTSAARTGLRRAALPSATPAQGARTARRR